MGVICLLYKTHAAGGFIAGFLITGDPLSGAIAMVSSLIPDIESPKSFIGRKLPIISHANRMVFGHRQVFHSLVGSLAFFLISLCIVKGFHFPMQYAYAALIGYLSHLVLDSFNPAGVPWLWPLGFRLKIPLTQSGGILERLVIMPGMMLIAVVLLGKHLLPFLDLFGRR